MYKFRPILKTLVWGTESWVLSGVPGSESVVAEGPDAGKALSEIYGGEFPLLIKFIDARQDLSIQVHPDDELAARRHGCKGKTEMWYIIGASEGAHLYAGLSQQITPDEYAARVADGSITDVLADHKVAPGDVFFLPAGRIHAICGGCYLAEIQETSDITYRLYDYNRPGLDGKPRQLHTEQAKDAIDYKVYPEYRTPYECIPGVPTEIVKCTHFTTALLKSTEPVTIPTEGDAFILICAEGSATVTAKTAGVKGDAFDGGLADGAVISTGGATISAGEAVLLTAAEASVTLTPGRDGLTLLTTHC